MKHVRWVIILLLVAASAYLIVNARQSVIKPDDIDITLDSDSSETVDTAVSAPPAPTPDFKDMAAQIKREEAENENTAAAVPVRPSSPVNNPEDYGLDLWLDGSPIVGGINPYRLDENWLFTKRRDREALMGGFHYNSQIKLTNEKKLDNREGWYITLLNTLFSKDIIKTEKARILRFSEDMMLDETDFGELKDKYPLNALRRDTMTYKILEDTARDWKHIIIEMAGSMKSHFNSSRYLPEIKRMAIEESSFYTPAYSMNIGFIKDKTIALECKVAQEDLLSILMAHFSKYKQSIQNNTKELSELLKKDPLGQNLNTPINKDYLHYALSSMDLSHLNVLVVDSLGLPDLNEEQYKNLFRDYLSHYPELSIGIMACRLDYVGIISNINGRALRSGFLWGMMDYRAKEASKNNFSITYAYPMAMPRSILILVIGPTNEAVVSYIDKLTSKLDELKQDETTLGGRRGVRAEDIDSYYVYRYQNNKQPAVEFGFDYRVLTLAAMNVNDTQFSSIRKAQADMTDIERFDFLPLPEDRPPEDLNQMASDEQHERLSEAIPDVQYEDVPYGDEEELIRVVQTSLKNPLEININLPKELLQAIDLSQESFSFDLDLLNQNTIEKHSSQDVRMYSDKTRNELFNTLDKAILDEQQNVYVFHQVELPAQEPGKAVSIKAEWLGIKDSLLSIKVSAEKSLPAGYYWVRLTAYYKTDSSKTLTGWNNLLDHSWIMPSDGTGFSLTPLSEDVLEGSWDYTGSQSRLTGFMTTDFRYLKLGNINESVKVLKIEKEKESLQDRTHAWGVVGSNSGGTSFPANIPPVFSVFQLNRLCNILRDSIFIRNNEIDMNYKLFDIEFIIHVPLH